MVYLVGSTSDESSYLECTTASSTLSQSGPDTSARDGSMFAMA